MKRIFITLAITVAVSSIALGQTKDKQAEQNKVGPNSQAEQEIMNLENELVKAGLRGDAATTDRLMADDYFFMTRDGVVHENLKASLLIRMKSGQGKLDLLASMESGERDEPKPHPLIIEDSQVHVYGNTGVVIVRSTYKSRSKEGSVIEVPTRFMHVWVRQQGRWQLVAGSSTRIAPITQ
jgi:ketosteroid isomerase-like protein